jgi:hypothetical protein
MPIFAEAPGLPSNELRLEAIQGGLSLKYDPTQLTDRQSPLMQNMVADDLGALNKRNGQAFVYTSSLGSGRVHGAYKYLFHGSKIFTWDTQMYKQTGSSAPVSIKTGLANADGSFYSFNDKLYYVNGTNFVVVDSSLSASDVVGYIPTLIISSPPAGGGTTFEQINLLQPGFKTSFSGDGTTKIYQLPLKGLDATAVTATVDGVAKVEGTDFTVNRSTGVVTFTTAPTNGTNNVIITAYKTVSGNADRIKNCKYLIDYGGDNDTRLFAWGNDDFRNRVFRSGLLDPTYWPENEYSDVGSSSEAVTMCAKQYDKLLYLKEKSIAFTTYQNPVTQGFWGASQIGASFPVQWINGAVGCDMPGSVQIINNNVVFGNSDLGLFIIVNVSIRDERNVRPISGNINGTLARPGLLNHTQSLLQVASSVDDGSNYWLCVGNEAYVWNYRLSPFTDTGNIAADEDRLSWFYHTNINASCWILDGQDIFYGSRSVGQIATFISNYNDFGSAINAIWRSKLWSFNYPDWLKTVFRAWFTSKAGGYSTVTIKYIDEDGETLDSEDININSFRWDQAAWDTWTWAINEYPPSNRLRIMARRIVYFQIEFSNNEVNESLSLMSLVLLYWMIRKVH